MNVATCLIVVFVSILATAAEPSEKKVNELAKQKFFESKVLPLLKSKCYSCHSHDAKQAKGGLVLDSSEGWKKGGGLGPAIVAGDPDNSAVIQAVRYNGLEMPPGEQLEDSEIQILVQWIASGAFDNRENLSTQPAEGALWALKPISNPQPPKVNMEKWLFDSVDSFILAKLEQNDLVPAIPADKYAWLRRVTFDLTGLAPTPKEISDFVADSSESAFISVVDRLLDSPGFGDHWARHWFDLSCYADVQNNTLIGDTWRYRDYVIKAFNDDKPFNRFIHEQIAGDLMPFDSVEQKRELMIATGYLSIGPWVIENYIKPQLAADIVDHQIDRIGRTFLGQTISCARCHDHKFDPIPTRDYYALAGIFHSSLTTKHTGPGVWSSIIEHELPALPIDDEKQSARQRRQKDLELELEQLRAEMHKWYRTFPDSTDANVLISSQGMAPNSENVKYELSFDVGPTVWAAAEQATRKGDSILIELIDAAGEVAKRIETFPHQWAAEKENPSLTKNVSSYVGNGKGMLTMRITSGNPGNKRFAGSIDNIEIRSGDEVYVQEDFDEPVDAPLRGKQAHTGLLVLAQVNYDNWKGLGINHSHAVEISPGNLAIQIFSGSRTIFKELEGDTEEATARLAKAITTATRIKQLKIELNNLAADKQPEYAMSMTDIPQPLDVNIYRRGDFNLLGEQVPRGVLGLTNREQRLVVPTNQSGRLQLAQWLTADANTLTSRVLVNRIWHHLFGRGLVSTVDYFGVHGQRPSHPDLLDFISTRFRVDNQWSVKQTIRQLVLSNTYRMSSMGNEENTRRDPDNILLWRMNRRRLSAESIRDAMLQISGTLDTARGGSSLGLELEGNIRGAGGDVNPPTWGGKIAQYVKNRRTVYQPLRRHPPSGDLEILPVFNFPHPNDITGARPQTTVATQALFLMNAPFVKAQATNLNLRIHQKSGNDESARLQLLYLLVTGRPPSESEAELSLRFLDSLAMRDNNGIVNPVFRRNAWEQLCHGLLVSNNFLFKE